MREINRLKQALSLLERENKRSKFKIKLSQFIQKCYQFILLLTLEQAVVPVKEPPKRTRTIKKARAPSYNFEEEKEPNPFIHVYNSCKKVRLSKF